MPSAPSSVARRRVAEKKRPSEYSATGESSMDEREDINAPVKTNDSRGLPVMEKVKKAARRSFVGTVLMGSFSFIIYTGHIAVCGLVFFIQCCLFGELVGVRKKVATEKHLPLFRTMQWLWFLLAAFYTWSDSMQVFVQEHPMMLRHSNSVGRRVLLQLLEKSNILGFGGYCSMMVLSILTLRKPYYRYQIGQYCWTLTTCCLVLFQMRAVFHMIYSGLFWFVLPTWLVISNDISAYFCGQIFGKKIFSRPFLEISPNKTWEGFFGSAICTMIFGWWLAGFLSKMQIMICAPQDILATSVSCSTPKLYEFHPIEQVLAEIFPEDVVLDSVTFCVNLVKAAIWRTTGSFDACPAQVHSLALALFASFIAPFGGFLASAIKRAYGIKDFGVVLGGHGGLMDRFDCQFVMMMCTYVHYSTYCRQVGFTVDALVAAASVLKPEQIKDLVERLEKELLAKAS